MILLSIIDVSVDGLGASTTVTNTTLISFESECGVGGVYDCPPAPVPMTITTTTHVTSDLESRIDSGIISLTVAAVTYPLPGGKYTALALAFLTGYASKELAFPGTSEGDITITTTYPDLDSPFLCYGNKYYQMISTTYFVRDNEIIYVGDLLREGYCVQR